MTETENEDRPAKVSSADETFVFLLTFWVIICLVLVWLAYGFLK